MEKKGYMANCETLMEQVTRGAFLTVRSGGEVNTMTIGWATIGVVWAKKVLMVAVRNSRHTFQLIEKTDNFTVSIPADSNCKEALKFCGTKSGKDFDKFKECRLGQKPALEVASPVIDIPGTHYECRIIYKTAMDSALLDPALISLYPQNDYHTLYFGEVVECYELK
ncbi:MAG: flavin reductase family protein [Desulfopila sp.]